MLVLSSYVVCINSLSLGNEVIVRPRGRWFFSSFQVVVVNRDRATTATTMVRSSKVGRMRIARFVILQVVESWVVLVFQRH